MSSSENNERQLSPYYKHLYRGDGKNIFTDKYQLDDIVEVDGRKGVVECINRDKITVRLKSSIDYDYIVYHSSDLFPKIIKSTDEIEINPDFFRYTTTNVVGSYLANRKYAKNKRENDIEKCLKDMGLLQEEMKKIQKNMVNNVSNIEQFESDSIRLTEILAEQGLISQKIKELKRSSLKVDYEEQKITTTYVFEKNKFVWCKELCPNYPIIYTGDTAISSI